MSKQPQSRFVSQRTRYYALYTGGFIGFIVMLSIFEQMGVSNKILGYLFLGVTVLIYAGIGILSRTSVVAEYYVAGRRVPVDRPGRGLLRGGRLFREFEHRSQRNGARRALEHPAAADTRF